MAICTNGACSILDVEDSGEVIMVGDSLPQFSVTMNDGSTLSTSDLQGKPSLIIFFTAWCKDCKEVMPYVNQLYLELGVGAPEGSSEQVNFVCIGREEAAEDVQAYWEEAGYSLKYSAQDTREVYNLFTTTRVPRIYISDSELVVRSAFDDDPVPSYEQLKEALNEILK